MEAALTKFMIFTSLLSLGWLPPFLGFLGGPIPSSHAVEMNPNFSVIRAFA
jgi:hypothetical protein